MFLPDWSVVVLVLPVGRWERLEEVVDVHEDVVHVERVLGQPLGHGLDDSPNAFHHLWKFVNKVC